MNTIASKSPKFLSESLYNNEINVVFTQHEQLTATNWGAATVSRVANPTWPRPTSDCVDTTIVPPPQNRNWEWVFQVPALKTNALRSEAPLYSFKDFYSSASVYSNNTEMSKICVGTCLRWEHCIVQKEKCDIGVIASYELGLNLAMTIFYFLCQNSLKSLISSLCQTWSSHTQNVLGCKRTTEPLGKSACRWQKNQCSINFTAVEERSTRLYCGDFVQNSQPLLVILLCKNETRETKTGRKNGKNVEKTILSAVCVSAPLCH